MRFLSFPLLIILLSISVTITQIIFSYEPIVPLFILSVNTLIIMIILPKYKIRKAPLVIFKMHKMLPLIYFTYSFKFYNFNQYLPVEIETHYFISSLIVYGILDLFRIVVYENLKGFLHDALYMNSNIKLLEFDYYTKRILNIFKFEKISTLYLFNREIFNPHSNIKKKKFFYLSEVYRGLENDEDFSPTVLFEKWSHKYTAVRNNLNEDGRRVEVRFLEKDSKAKKRNYTKMKKFYETSELYLKNKYNELSQDDIPQDDLPIDTLNEEYNIEDMLITESHLISLYGSTYGKKIFNFISFFENSPINFARFESNLNQINLERRNFHEILKNQDLMCHILNRVFLAVEYTILISISVHLLDIKSYSLAISGPFILLTICPYIVFHIYAFTHLIFTHPYDCGDRVYIKGENLIVKKIEFFSTIFTKWNGEYVVLYNNELLKCQIGNAKRSQKQSGIIRIAIKADISKYKLDSLISRIEKAAESNQYFNSITVSINRIIESNIMELKIFLKHNNNFQVAYFMWKRHTAFMIVIKEILKDMKIEGIPLTERFAQIN